MRAYNDTTSLKISSIGPKIKSDSQKSIASLNKNLPFLTELCNIHSLFLSMEGAVGRVRLKRCTVLTCEQTGGNRPRWRREFSNKTCCSYQRTGYKVGETILEVKVEEECSLVNIACILRDEVPHIEVKAENTCDVNKTLVDKVDKVLELTEKILERTGDCLV